MLSRSTCWLPPVYVAVADGRKYAATMVPAPERVKAFASARSALVVPATATCIVSSDAALAASMSSASLFSLLPLLSLREAARACCAETIALPCGMSTPPDATTAARSDACVTVSKIVPGDTDLGAAPPIMVGFSSTSLDMSSDPSWRRAYLRGSRNILHEIHAPVRVVRARHRWLPTPTHVRVRVPEVPRPEGPADRVVRTVRMPGVCDLESRRRRAGEDEVDAVAADRRRARERDRREPDAATHVRPVPRAAVQADVRGVHDGHGPHTVHSVVASRRGRVADALERVRGARREVVRRREADDARARVGGTRDHEWVVPGLEPHRVRPHRPDTRLVRRRDRRRVPDERTNGHVQVDSDVGA